MEFDLLLVFCVSLTVETRSTTTTTEGYEHHAEILHEESVDTAEDPDSPHDRLAKDEVVNCICQLNEENGLMIQVRRTKSRFTYDSCPCLLLAVFICWLCLITV